MKIASHTEEHKLLISIARNDEAAFRRLFVMFRDKVYSYSLHFTRSVFIAEEITQEVFMKIWVNRKALAEVNSIEAWVITITRNLCFNQLKKNALEQRIKNSIPIHEPAAEDNNAEAYMSYKDQLSRINEAIGQLSPQQRLIYKLNRDQGLKNEEIAHQLNISLNTVKTHMVAALRKIRDFLKTHPTNIFFFVSPLLIFFK
jgi:RNA polymerase sigma-70 factor (family 1)